jgi:hypothetical protein
MDGFELLREQEIPEINTRARLFRHVKTGAELLSLENDDENKCFGITFRTPPSDSTGVAHILEHCVLAGSRKYPLKDPFAALLKGSVKTFLNAFTFPDKTCYPVASQNLQDFYNLVDVYLDTVFYPLLRRQTFEQQGWHYELERPEDPLIFKGVVFNEMKGNYSSPDSVLAEYTQQVLFPDNTYGVDSGGDPKNIPDLTYEQFKQFHQTFYHPSNARIFFYGDDEPNERLRIIDAYLAEFEPIATQSDVALQTRFDMPKQITRNYAVGEANDGERKAMVNLAWMFDEATDPETTLAFNILSYMLLGTPAAPLRKALIESGLGEDTTGAGLSDSLRQMMFSVGLKGVAQERTGDVETLILQTLTNLANDGIDQATVEAALNTVEFYLRENNTGAFPRGLSLMIRTLDLWLYDRDPLAPLAFEAPLAAIKQRVASGPGYFEGLIRRYFLDNTHRVTLRLLPDSELSKREAEAERARLDQARAAMSEADLQAIIDNTQLLKRIQETPDPPEVLAGIPSLKLSDLDRYNKPIPLVESEQHGTRLLYHDLFTNGIVYLDLGLDLHALPQELLPFVPLFGRALQELGTEKEDYVKLSQRIGRATGGIRATPTIAVQRGSDQAAAWLILRSKATLDRAGELLAILRDMLLTAQLDNQERFRQMALEEKASREAGLAPGGHIIVNTRLRSYFSEADWANEQIGGVSYLFFLRNLAQQVESDWPSVLGALEKIRTTLLNRRALICNVTLDEAGYIQFAPQLSEFLAGLPATQPQTAVWTPARGSGYEGLTFPGQVNYVGKGANLYALGYQPNGAATVVNRYLSTTWLWDKVRVQGGAYGGFATFDQRSGMFTYLSYRDPNLLATLDVYDQTGAFLRQANLSEDELTRSIIGTIGDMDAYQLPDAKGYTSMIRLLVGDTDEIRQRTRDEILATTRADFLAFADALDHVREKGLIVVLGGPAAVEAANRERGGQLEITRVLG